MTAAFFMLFFDCVLQEDDAYKSGKDRAVKGEVFQPSGISGKVHVEAESRKKDEKQSLQKIFCSSAHCYTPP